VLDRSAGPRRSSIRDVWWDRLTSVRGVQ